MAGCDVANLSFVDKLRIVADAINSGKLTFDSANFNGNLTPSDDTLQEIFDKLDNLNLGIGSSTFVGLTDTPNSFMPNKMLKVNATGDGFIFVDESTGGLNLNEPMKIMFLGKDAVVTVEELQLIKDTGYNTLMAYNWGDGNLVVADMIANSKTVGLKNILHTGNGTIVSSYHADDNVIGFYVFDEPQINGVDKAAQNAQIDAIRLITNKPLFIADNGDDWDIDNLSDRWDYILADLYLYGVETIEQAKTRWIKTLATYKFKTPSSKIVPCIGLFRDAIITQPVEEVAKMALEVLQLSENGDMSCFIWDHIDPASSLDEMVKNNVFYRAKAKEFAQLAGKQRKINLDYWLFFNGGNFGGLRDVQFKMTPTYPKDGYYNISTVGNWVGSNLLPFSVKNVGAATDVRSQNWAFQGIGVKNNGGVLLLQNKHKLKRFYAGFKSFNNISGDMTISIGTVKDDGYTLTELATHTVLIADGTIQNFALKGEVDTSEQLYLKVVCASSYEFPHKFLSGWIVSSDW